MYSARFELDFGPCWVLGGRVLPGTPGLVPAELLSALVNGRIRRLAVRCLFDAEGQHSTILLPCEDDAQLAPMRTLLADVVGVEWCRDSMAFDAIGSALPTQRRWLDNSNFYVQGLAFAVSASLLPDWAVLRRLGAQEPLLHQVNILNQPASTEEQRALRKHLARIDLLTDDAVLPATRSQVQRRIVESRLTNPLMLDELLACTSDAQCHSAMTPLQERLFAQGGASLAGAVAQKGNFDELLQTGLDSGRFLNHDPVSSAGRTVDTATLRAALCQANLSARKRATDVFISHASSDAQRAQRLCSYLEAGGMRCWIAPRDIAAGRHYAEVIEDALRDSHAVLLLLSEAAMESTHVLRELERAVHYRALVLPLRLTDRPPHQAYRYLLSGCQWTDALSELDDAVAVPRLLTALARES